MFLIEQNANVDFLERLILALVGARKTISRVSALTAVIFLALIRIKSYGAVKNVEGRFWLDITVRMCQKSLMNTGRDFFALHVTSQAFDFE